MYLETPAARMLSENDLEDLKDGLEPLDLPKRRLLLAPLADREETLAFKTAVG